MCRLFVFTLFALSLLNKMCQTQLMEPLADTQTFPCNYLTENIRSPDERFGFLTLNQTNFEIRLSLIPEDCIYLYTVASIVIVLRDSNDVLNIDYYNITYRVNDTLSTVPLRQIMSSTEIIQSNSIIVATRVNIHPISLEELWISRFINTNGSFRVRYGIFGYSTPRITVLDYLIAEPFDSDETYTGLCNGEVCYGGRGRLMDGYIGDNSDIFRSELNTRWDCLEEDGCNFPLRIQLTRHVCYIKLHGFYLKDEFLLISIPEVTLINPNQETNVEIDERNTSTNTYSIEIPIDSTVTSEIFIYMNVPVRSRLVLSEVEVISNGVNIAPFGNEPPTNSQTNVTTNEIPYIIFSLIIVLMLIIIAALVITIIFMSIRNKNVKHQTDIGKAGDDDFSRYSDRVHNEIYTTIGPEIPQSERPKPINVFKNNESIKNTYVESGSLSENPIYPGKKDLALGIETLQTPLQTLNESSNSKGEDENHVEKTCEQGEEKPKCERIESIVFDMRDNSIYKKGEAKPQGYDQLNLKKEDIQGYDALRH